MEKHMKVFHEPLHCPCGVVLEMEEMVQYQSLTCPLRLIVIGVIRNPSYRVEHPEVKSDACETIRNILDARRKNRAARRFNNLRTPPLE
ncbi:hypothetical protein ACMD2_08624 [Ananas comosus]|uniref:Uncharacterized protein n=1 Tax=Ananas comosus TaxID=4615 RepID=A0A199VR08_ANACO|nr:hypothetical protein ACMD2_08624 [Ananas comosus]